MTFRTTLLVTTLLVASACENAPPVVDAGVDAGSDAGPQPSELFGPCVLDSQCPGEGAVCRRDTEGFPGGYCTHPCVDFFDCVAFGLEQDCGTRPDSPGLCELRCLNGLDCGRSGYTCIRDFNDPMSAGYCIGICSSDAQCTAGTECDELSGRCYATGTVPTAGAPHGAPCADDTECGGGQCATAWPEGYCYSLCILPPGWNSNTLYDGDAFPAAGCVGDDAICYPALGALGEGEPGVCLDGCVETTDCRAGYECVRTFNLASGPRTFPVGVCMPPA